MNEKTPFILESEMTKKFADNLKQLRKNKSISQENLANRLGVSRCTIQSYEKACYIPNAYIVFIIAHYFSINMVDMLCKDLCKEY